MVPMLIKQMEFLNKMLTNQIISCILKKIKLDSNNKNILFTSRLINKTRREHNDDDDGLHEIYKDKKAKKKYFIVLIFL